MKLVHKLTGGLKQQTRPNLLNLLPRGSFFDYALQTDGYFFVVVVGFSFNISVPFIKAVHLVKSNALINIVCTTVWIECF